MSLVGQLKDLGLDDILKIICLSRKSGCLTLRGQGQEWVVVLRQGEVARLSSDRVLPVLVEQLQRQAVADQNVLDQAQRLLADGAAPDLLSLLSDRFGVSAEALTRIVRQVADNFLAELGSWREGEFSFEVGDGYDEPPPGDGGHHLFLEADGPAGRSIGSGVQDRAPVDGVAQVASAVRPGSKGNPIWIVENDPWLRQQLGHYLQRHDVVVETFETAADFWTRLKKAVLVGICPMAVIDLTMPHVPANGGLGGLDLVHKVRADYPQVPVLPLAHRDCRAGDTHGLVDAGISRVLVKPHDIEREGEAGRQALRTFAQSLLSSLNQSDVASPLQPAQPQQARPRERSKDLPGVHLLEGMLEELNNPALGGGFILLVLRFASELMNRAVIFLVKEESFVGIGQFGVVLDGGDTDAAIRNIVIPRNCDSVLGRLLKEPYCLRTRFSNGEWDKAICRALGGKVPTELFLGPLVSEDRVVAILYGDNLPEQAPVGNTEALEIFLSQAGLAMEKALSQGKLLKASCNS